MCSNQIAYFNSSSYSSEMGRMSMLAAMRLRSASLSDLLHDNTLER
jgi:hypothetical protein